LSFGDERAVDPDTVDRALERDTNIGHVLAVHVETTAGVLNPIAEIAAVAEHRGRKLIVDAMSAFGGIPFDGAKVPFEALVASSNKCLEGVPGLGFAIVSRAALQSAQR